MADLATYQFPARPQSGVLFGLSIARLAALGLAGVVFIMATAAATATSLAVGAVAIIGLLASVAVPVGGRAAIDWIPIWLLHGWSMATRNNEFYASPDLGADLPAEVLDLPGELFGIELHTFEPPAEATLSASTAAAFGMVRDTFRGRVVAVAEVSGADFLFLDPDVQQARVSAWGATLDHVAQTMPDVCRIQVVHIAAPASTNEFERHHHTKGHRGSPQTRESYRELLVTSSVHSQHHRVLVALAVDTRAARRAIRQAGGGVEGSAHVLMDRAATVEEALRRAELEVHGWLTAPAIAGVLRAAFDPAVRHASSSEHDGDTECEPEACGPWGMVDQWSAVRHDSGWSTTLQVVRPPSRPVAGDFLQHLLVGVPAHRRMSLLLVPTPMAIAERRAQTQQVTTESEQALRARWGFGASARHRREHDDANRREEDLVDGRAVYRVVWMVTVTAPTPTALEAAVGHTESAARRCGVELRRMAGTQRQAAAFTLPLCRGAR